MPGEKNTAKKITEHKDHNVEIVDFPFDAKPRDLRLVSMTYTFSVLRNTTIFSLLLLAGGCASVSKRNASTDNAEKNAPAQVDPTQQKFDQLSLALSKVQGRIEELEAKLTSLSDSLASTKTAVDNLTGPAGVKTVGIGSHDDGVAQNEEEKQDMKAAHEMHGSKSSESDDATISAFTKAMNLYRSSKYSDAVLAFNHFVELFPDHALASSAQFFAAESYFSMGEFKLSLAEYQKILTTYKKSPRVPTALVRISHVYHALGDEKQSEKYLSAANTIFPGHPALDWPAPSSTPKSKVNRSTSSHHASAPLEAAPMEPKHDSIPSPPAEELEKTKHAAHNEE